ncbi:MAG: MOSC N-terminal beta barrel domain-containing protein [Cyanobacteria bacterium P01_A01_bin.135]
MVSLSSLYIYPIKSARGIALSTAQITERGFQHDRRWMLVDRGGKFISQRTCPKLALVTVAIEKGELVVEAPHHGSQRVALQPPSTATRPVEVWGDRCEAVPMADSVNDWFSKVLEQPCQLVYMPDHSNRPVDHGKAPAPDGSAALPQVSFADAYPFLLISEASLADLNQRLSAPVPMNRFRPNLVVSGCEAFAEDEWGQIQVGSVPFQVSKSCSRCTITTVDQATGQRGAEPLKTLSTFRHWNGKIWFGQNLIQMGAGTLQIGDPVTVRS